MSHEIIGNWVEKAKSGTPAPTPHGVRVIRREEPRNIGAMIMDLAEKLRPCLLKMFHGVPGEDGIPMQPPHIRGLALNLAQHIIKTENDNKAA